jgi:hypothetical protein
MENDIEIVIGPKPDFEKLELVLIRNEDEPELEEVEYFDEKGYWKILADGQQLAYGYGWLFGKSQLDYYAEMILDEPYNIVVTNEETQTSKATKELIALGAFGGPDAPTAKERWEEEKKKR